MAILITANAIRPTRLVARAAKSNSPTEYLTTFQSRFGREEWLKPYTDHTLKSLPQQGIKVGASRLPGFFRRLPGNY